MADGTLRHYVLTINMRFIFRLTVESAEIQFRPLHPVRIEAEDAEKVEKLYDFLQVSRLIRERSSSFLFQNGGCLCW